MGTRLISLVLWLSLSASLAYPQDYFRYQRQLNRVDEDVLDARWTEAMQRMDSLEAEYAFIYARHCIKGLQLAVIANDSLRMETWLRRCFLRGVPLWLIRSNPLMGQSLQYANIRTVALQFDSLHQQYLNSLHQPLVRLLDSLIIIDQRLTEKVNDGFVVLRPFYGLSWLHNNKRQYRVLREVIATHGFPGERLVGISFWQLDSATSYNEFSFWGPDLRETRVRTMLLHCFSSPRDDLNELLLPAVEQGYLPAYQYGAFNDFLAAWGKRKYRRNTYYNVWHHDPDSNHLSLINRKRERIGLNTFEQQQRNDLLNRERRKLGIMDSCVLLE